jgi:heparin/heparan-sulfate lyase
MIARTGWDEKSVIAEMKINVYNFNNHQHMDAGAFQIYYRGSLATVSGLYGGTDGGYGSPHGKNYFWRTIAHNSLLIYDPQEKFSRKGDYGNDGGQRLPNQRMEPANLEVFLDPVNAYKTGEVLAQGFGPSKQTPDYTYMKGDISQAYSSKVKEVKRSFIFLNLKNEEIPAALIVYDKVISSSPSYKKYWLLHSIEEPSIKGNEVMITQTTNTGTGKLVNVSLLPEIDNLELKAVGGPGKEFWVFGKNYENESRDNSGESTYERAAWRIELSPKKHAQENYFLNIMQIMDKNARQLSVKKIDGEKITGVQLADRLVFVSKTFENINASCSFSIQEKGNFKILLTDLLSGTWQVIKDNLVVIPEIPVKETDGLLYFEGTNGKYTFTYLQPLTK